ncbi:MAG TPA: dihydroorotate dehydrogenase electron transfer subunit [Pirellulales bacterium]|jgi:dihydroorotate dehydrogenase electron transfer subunit
MTSAEARYFADRAGYRRVEIVENVELARDTYRVRLACPGIARDILPGQFLMVRLPETDDPLLGRPMALYDTASASGDPRSLDAVDVVYLTVGKMTTRLARLTAGQPLEVWGPLGNGFALHACEHLVMVAGGIGQTPFLALARERLGLRSYGERPREVPLPRKVTLCYGVRNRAYLAGVAEFEALGVEVHVSTDDGTAGLRGLVTQTSETVLDSSAQAHIVCCGPEPMMAAVAKIAQTRGITCEASLETPMACGIGICFSCVARVRDGEGGWDYRRTCVEGPVFDADQIVW